jgi:hypothetical protein
MSTTDQRCERFVGKANCDICGAEFDQVSPQEYRCPKCWLITYENQDDPPASMASGSIASAQCFEGADYASNAIKHVRDGCGHETPDAARDWHKGGRIFAITITAREIK